MGIDVLSIEKKLLSKNKWSYSIGGIGRDMIYQLVATFLMTYIQFSGLGLNRQQFGVIGIMLVIGRVWDAVNDPFMGSIVENTHSKWGKFRPWILIGGILTGVAILIMFNFRAVTGWGFVVFFAIIYLFWELAFTLNDIPYWSLIPALSHNKKDRDSITTMVVVFAGVGAFIANAIVSFTTVGNAVAGYRMVSILFVTIFLACTFLTVFGVKEPQEAETSRNADKATLKKMFYVIFHNDQLLWASLALILYTVGSGLLVALGYNFFYLEIGYNGTLTLAFIATFGISTIVVQSFYAALAKKFTRKQLMTYSIIRTVVGYVAILSLGWFDWFIPINVVTVCLFGFLVFSGQAIFYMVLIVNMANTIEYNQYKTGERNEAIVFALRPFVAKFGSAIEQGIFAAVLLISGVFLMSQNVSALEYLKNSYSEVKTNAERLAYLESAYDGTSLLDSFDFDEENNPAIVYGALQAPENQVFTIANATEAESADLAAYIAFVAAGGDAVDAPTYAALLAIAATRWQMNINTAADSVFHNMAADDTAARVILRLAITFLPVLMIVGSFIVLRKKYFINEKYYEEITAAVRQRAEVAEKA